MFIEKNGLRVKLEWRHSNPDFTSKMDKYIPEDTFVGTTCICTVTSLENSSDSVSFESRVKLRPGDSFCKDLGRRFSAHRVFNTIRSSTVFEDFRNKVILSFRNKEFRTAIWQNYINETNPKLYKVLNKE